MRSLVELAMAAREQDETRELDAAVEKRVCNTPGCGNKLNRYRTKMYDQCWKCREKRRRKQIREAQKRYDEATGRKHPRRKRDEANQTTEGAGEAHGGDVDIPGLDRGREV